MALRLGGKDGSRTFACMGDGLRRAELGALVHNLGHRNRPRPRGRSHVLYWRSRQDLNLNPRFEVSCSIQLSYGTMLTRRERRRCD